MSNTIEASINDCLKNENTAFCCASGPNSSVLKSKSSAETRAAICTPFLYTFLPPAASPYMFTADSCKDGL